VKKKSRVCGKHFDKSQFVRDRLIKGALPCDKSNTEVDKHPVGVVHQGNDATCPRRKKISKQLFPLTPLTINSNVAVKAVPLPLR
jgi:hypothetical protein